MLWTSASHSFDLRSESILLGVLNVTPDSFSDGGQFHSHEDAVRQARLLSAQGAQIIDVGGESTRPGAEPVPEPVELQRVLPIIHQLVHHEGLTVSIDTRKPGVARAALEAGASILNDVHGLRDPEMRKVLRESRAAAIVMHMQGSPATMQQNPSYPCVVSEIRSFFHAIAARCAEESIPPQALAFDPGIGFGKNLDHNLRILSALPSLPPEGRPLVLGVSKKSFLGKLVRSESLEHRLWPTVALSAYARLRGARIFRVHDPLPNLHAARMAEAFLSAPP